jgi:type II secretory pathway pseudopilin PulG
MVDYGLDWLGGDAARKGASSRPKGRRNHFAGFTVLELMIAMVVGVIVTAAAVPTVINAMTMINLNSAANDLGAVISGTRYRAIMNSQKYTLALTTPANTYVVTNVSANTAARAVPIPYANVSINGGLNATYTFTFCPNGTVYGAGAACPGTNNPPVLTGTYKGKQFTLTVTGAGNVTKTHN